ncbi:MAG: aminomethyl-transferring glycine dehydrogenase subunit GcvPA [Chromatiales bacterium]|nr:aminomethyl-transferring glycine dehydrogenase subunit GcvPA [Chromatiales bacterium]
MPFIPHNEKDVRDMLDTIGVSDIEQLFDEIPDALRLEDLEGVPEAMREMDIQRLMRSRAASDGSPLCFIGAGAYEHHIPAAIWEIATRGEFYSAYTPYQAEASQGTLQLIYEYQTMMSSLTGLDVSNASLYDGATALAEAALMAVRANRKSKSGRILIAGAVNPVYLKVCQAITGNQGLKFEPLGLEIETGLTDLTGTDSYEGEDITALVIQQPNFLGNLEDVDRLTDWAHSIGAMVIAVVNPISLALLKPPGDWGEQGADIACGEGQPLGVPLSSGGPFFGLLTAKKAFVRQMPGRIVGRTLDLEGREGFTLTLQAREQHIRRSKATSNICTNQGLMVTAATIYMSLMGADGLEQVASACIANTSRLAERLDSVDGVSVVFDGPRFHEAVLRLDRPVAPVLEALAKRNVLGGLDLSVDYPQLGNAFLVCATETKTAADIEYFATALAEIMRQARVA